MDPQTTVQVCPGDPSVTDACKCKADEKSKAMNRYSTSGKQRGQLFPFRWPRKREHEVVNTKSNTQQKANEQWQ